MFPCLTNDTENYQVSKLLSYCYRDKLFKTRKFYALLACIFNLINLILTFVQAELQIQEAIRNNLTAVSNDEDIPGFFESMVDSSSSNTSTTISSSFTKSETFGVSTHIRYDSVTQVIFLGFYV